MYGVPGIMPPPVSVDGIEQRQAVDGQVAVEVVLGVEDQAARGSRPSRPGPVPAPPRASGDVDRSRRGTGCSWRDWYGSPVAVSDEEVGHGTTEAGQLGEVFDDVVLAEDNGGLVIRPIDRRH